MHNLCKELVDEIVETCLNLYKNTPKTGKPIDKEWTVLACIVKLTNNHEVEVVSLGTGSKCVGASKMSPKGDILNDSHAEVFARRGFLLYLYDNIDKALENQPSIFNYSGGKFQLKDGIEFAFYSSQLPCGDTCIIPKSEYDDEFGDIIETNKHMLDFSDRETVHKKFKLDNDIHRTGAKCLPNCDQDTKEPGNNYHNLGQVRTKPGRGDRTLSVSCSDKIAKWIRLGIQGSLLSLLCEHIYMKHFIFGAGVPYSEESLQRALLTRDRGCETLMPKIIPDFYQSTLNFTNIRSELNIRPAPGSIVWVKLSNPSYMLYILTPKHTANINVGIEPTTAEGRARLLEVAVQGKKLGVTKKKETSPKSWLCICKYNIYKRFTDIINKHDKIKQTMFKNFSKDSVPYNEMKMRATDYNNQWMNLKEKFFKVWTVKPDMWDFCITST